ncbi:nitroreductase [Mycolicibacterium cosmeticum]|uniref:Nitroreductase n=1 Tax=Mycolicibacterium cosmeticum TaxID=258533 RepID=W9BKD1_MYCCO|nr:nitroreductase family protein [Mycolicibacterium cosmeticum]TLH80471.1 nitroreductase [Mycolicibacterium cosmeticum]CDO07690.1 nitroreductase [Mycolicibacterium cosmeticum]
MSDRLARTSVPIHPPIAARWSPRAFDANAVLSPDDLTALLEAARWAATWGQREPVRYVVGFRGREEQDGFRGDEMFTTVAGLLKRGNSYATAASALILVCADEGEDERTARYAAVDVGAAIASLSIEAVSRGLVVHPMAGFDTVAAAELTPGLRPFAVVAVGTLGDYTRADEAIVERDHRPRERLGLDRLVLNWPSGPR